MTEKYTRNVRVKAHHQCGLHRTEIEKSTLCGCFYCLRTYAPALIDQKTYWRGDKSNWIDEGETALCPMCGIDSVLPDSTGLPVTDPEFLKAMHDHWFGRTTSSERTVNCKIWEQQDMLTPEEGGVYIRVNGLAQAFPGGLVGKRVIVKMAVEDVIDED